MVDNLLGYLLGALESNDIEEVVRALESNPDLGRQVELLRRALEPLELCPEPIEPPPNLAVRTWILVQQSAAVTRGQSS